MIERISLSDHQEHHKTCWVNIWTINGLKGVNRPPKLKII